MQYSAVPVITEREDDSANYQHGLTLQRALERLDEHDSPPSRQPDLLTQRSLAEHRQAIDAVADDLPGTDNARSLVAMAFLDWRVAEGARLVHGYDRATFRHMSRVGVLGAYLADSLGHAILETRVITYAGLLHDVGKIGISADIIRAYDGPHAESDSAALDLRDRRFIAADLHPEIGFRLVRNLFRNEPHRILARTIPELVLGHHCCNQARPAYPTMSDQQKLIDEGELSTPLNQGRTFLSLAPLLAIADVYEAITAHRGYYGNRFDDPAEVEAALTAAHPDLEDARSVLMDLHARRISLTAAITT